MNDKEKIISLLNEFVNLTKNGFIFCWQFNSRFLFIIPNCNPIDAIGFEQIITGDIVKERSEINRLHRF